MVQNAFKPQKGVETRGRKRKTTCRENKLINHKVKMDPFISNNTIKKKIKLIVTLENVW